MDQQIMNQTKRIVIIEGDAFDADAIVAIVRFKDLPDSFKFGVYFRLQDHALIAYTSVDAPARDAAMAVAIDAWLTTVGYVPVVGATHPTLRLPDQPEPPERIEQFFTDTKGRYYETYSGQTVWWGETTGRFVWNDDGQRRKNPLGPGANPILKTYVDEAGKPLDPQPI